MRPAPRMVALVAFACSLPLLACAQAPVAEPPPSAPPPGPPPAAPPAPPPAAEAPPPTTAAPAADGQWVYTQQYGWVWMSYGDAYTYVPPDGTGEPLQYVYYPAHGWAWVVAPWIWGAGPWPYFGRPGPARFAWYSHGWWRTPSRWHFRAAPAPPRSAPRAELHARGIRPAPPRGERGERHEGAGHHR